MTALEQDRFKLALERFVRAASPNFDFYSWHAGRIVAPGSVAGTFDFQPDSSRLPGLQDVPLKTGIPGITLKLNPGVSPRCFLFFEEGRPDKPELALFDKAGLLGVQIAADVSINLNAPAVALGPSWLSFVTALTGASDPAVVAAATTLLSFLNSVH